MTNEYPWCQSDCDPAEEAMAEVWGPEMQRRDLKKSEARPELTRLLAEHSEILGPDLSTWHVYGSAMRPMSASWARIEGAVYMACDKSKTGFHTYVATPSPLSQEIMKQYELRLVLLGKTSL